jgi:hypothetical protein
MMNGFSVQTDFIPILRYSSEYYYYYRRTRVTPQACQRPLMWIHQDINRRIICIRTSGLSYFDCHDIHGRCWSCQAQWGLLAGDDRMAGNHAKNYTTYPPSPAGVISYPTIADYPVYLQQWHYTRHLQQYIFSAAILS